MTAYTRTIRGIERTMHYMKLQPASRYAAYRLTAFEQAPVVQRQDWNRLYNDAADSAAIWLKDAQDAQKRLDRMLLELGREAGIRDASFVSTQIDELVATLNQLESSYRSHESSLKSEVWEAVELALRHPAMEELGIRREAEHAFRWEGSIALQASDGAWSQDSKDGIAVTHYSNNRPNDADNDMPAILTDGNKLKRLLLGADGLIQDLKRALSFADQRQSIDLLRLPFAAAYPYTLYYGAMQAYLPLPYRGIVLNKYY